MDSHSAIQRHQLHKFTSEKTEHPFCTNLVKKKERNARKLF